MAQQADIDSVKVQLPDADILTEFGLDDITLGAILDSGASISQTILAGWRSIAAKTATMTDVSESGSSRNLSTLNANAREMCTLWQTQVDKELNSTGQELIRRWTSYKTTRV
jgi:hypothetical protein